MIWRAVSPDDLVSTSADRVRGKIIADRRPHTTATPRGRARSGSNHAADGDRWTLKGVAACNSRGPTPKGARRTGNLDQAPRLHSP